MIPDHKTGKLEGKSTIRNSSHMLEELLDCNSGQIVIAKQRVDRRFAGVFNIPRSCSRSDYNAIRSKRMRLITQLLDTLNRIIPLERHHQ